MRVYQGCLAAQRAGKMATTLSWSARPSVRHKADKMPEDCHSSAPPNPPPIHYIIYVSHTIPLLLFIAAPLPCVVLKHRIFPQNLSRGRSGMGKWRGRGPGRRHLLRFPSEKPGRASETRQGDTSGNFPQVCALQAICQKPESF